MKDQVRIYIGLLTVCVIVSCNKTIYEEQSTLVLPSYPACEMDEAPIFHPGEMIHGSVTGFKNCRPFMASAKAIYFSINNQGGIGILINTYEDWGFTYANKEYIEVGALSQSEGQYEMKNPFTNSYLGYYATTQDHDVYEDLFQMDSTYDHNEIYYSIIDKINNKVEGYFNSKFIVKHPKSGNNPDTVLFSDCHFIADIIE